MNSALASLALPPPRCSPSLPAKHSLHPPPPPSPIPGFSCSLSTTNGLSTALNNDPLDLNLNATIGNTGANKNASVSASDGDVENESIPTSRARASQPAKPPIHAILSSLLTKRNAISPPARYNYLYSNHSSFYKEINEFFNILDQSILYSSSTAFINAINAYGCINDLSSNVYTGSTLDLSMLAALSSTTKHSNNNKPNLNTSNEKENDYNHWVNATETQRILAIDTIVTAIIDGLDSLQRGASDASNVLHVPQYASLEIVQAERSLAYIILGTVSNNDIKSQIGWMFHNSYILFKSFPDILNIISRRLRNLASYLDALQMEFTLSEQDLTNKLFFSEEERLISMELANNETTLLLSIAYVLLQVWGIRNHLDVSTVLINTNIEKIDINEYNNLKETFLLALSSESHLWPSISKTIFILISQLAEPSRNHYPVKKLLLVNSKILSILQGDDKEYLRLKRLSRFLNNLSTIGKPNSRNLPTENVLDCFLPESVTKCNTDFACSDSSYAKLTVQEFLKFYHSQIHSSASKFSNSLPGNQSYLNNCLSRYPGVVLPFISKLSNGILSQSSLEYLHKIFDIPKFIPNKDEKSLTPDIVPYFERKSDLDRSDDGLDQLLLDASRPVIHPYRGGSDKTSDKLEKRKWELSSKISNSSNVMNNDIFLEELLWMPPSLREQIDVLSKNLYISVYHKQIISEFSRLDETYKRYNISKGINVDNDFSITNVEDSDKFIKNIESLPNLYKCAKCRNILKDNNEISKDVDVYYGCDICNIDKTYIGGSVLNNVRISVGSNSSELAQKDRNSETSTFNIQNISSDYDYILNNKNIYNDDISILLKQTINDYSSISKENDKYFESFGIVNERDENLENLYKVNIDQDLHKEKKNKYFNSLRDDRPDIEEILLKAEEYLNQSAIRINNHEKMEFFNNIRKTYSRLLIIDKVYSYSLPILPDQISMLIRLLYYVNLGEDSLSPQNDSANITNTSWFCPGKKYSNETMASWIERLDLARHKEVVTKTVSAIFLSLLKLGKLSHCLRGDFISYLLADNNCCILILKLFSIWFTNNKDISNNNDNTDDTKSKEEEIKPAIITGTGSLFLSKRKEPDILDYFFFVRMKETTISSLVDELELLSKGSAKQDATNINDQIKHKINFPFSVEEDGFLKDCDDIVDQNEIENSLTSDPLYDAKELALTNAEKTIEYKFGLCNECSHLYNLSSFLNEEPTLKDDIELKRKIFKIVNQDRCIPSEYVCSKCIELCDGTYTNLGPNSINIKGKPIKGPVALSSDRNFFSAITLLRILQKLTKNDAIRIQSLVSWKSGTVLKRVLKTNHSQLQLYALKLLQCQLPYLGRKWRSNSMRVISLMFLRLRPYMLDESLSCLTPNLKNTRLNSLNSTSSNNDTQDEDVSANINRRDLVRRSLVYKHHLDWYPWLKHRTVLANLINIMNEQNQDGHQFKENDNKITPATSISDFNVSNDTGIYSILKRLGNNNNILSEQEIFNLDDNLYNEFLSKQDSDEFIDDSYYYDDSFENSADEVLLSEYDEDFISPNQDQDGQNVPDTNSKRSKIHKVHLHSSSGDLLNDDEDIFVVLSPHGDVLLINPNNNTIVGKLSKEDVRIDFDTGSIILVDKNE